MIELEDVGMPRTVDEVACELELSVQSSVELGKGKTVRVLEITDVEVHG